MGRNSGYRREYRLPNGLAERNGDMGAGGGGGGRPDHDVRGQMLDPIKETEVSNGLLGLEKRLSGVQQDFTQAIHKISEKENEKFDLIFAILSELQTRQANLEESVRSLKTQYCGGQGYIVNGNMAQPQQQVQFSSSGAPSQQYGQMNGQMAVAVPGGQMNDNMGTQQPMQQFATMQQGVMQPVPQQMFTAIPQQQMIMMQSPVNNGGMQYVPAPQMIASQGVQQMPAQMAMQFIQHSAPEMFMNGQVDSQASGGSIQAQMNMIKAEGSEQQPMAWQPDGSSQAGTQEAGEAKSQNSAMSGIGSSETSSQEGKVDDGSPCPHPSMT